MVDRQAVDTGDLWRWVDRLTQPRRERVVRKAPGAKPRVEYFDVPSLWTQLLREIASSNSGGGHGAASAGSRPPINLEKAAILAEITNLVVDAIDSHGGRPRLLERTTTAQHDVALPRLLGDDGLPLLDPDLAGRMLERAARPAAVRRGRHDTARPIHDTSSDLRQLATLVVGTGDRDLITWWADQYRTWVARTETALGDDDESIDLRPVRDKACPRCEATYVVREQPSDAFASGRETFRDPALVIQFRDGQVLHVTCRACGTGWWRGEGLDELTEHLHRPARWLHHTGGDTSADTPLSEALPS